MTGRSEGDEIKEARVESERNRRAARTALEKHRQLMAALDQADAAIRRARRAAL